MNKNMNKYVKIGILILAVLLIYSCGVFVASTRNNNQNKTPKKEKEQPEKKENDNKIPEYSDYDILLPSKTILSYGEGIWFENPEFDFQNRYFNVYVDDTEYENMFITYSDRWLIYDVYKNFFDYEGNIFAINARKDYNLAKYSAEEITEVDEPVIKDFLNSKSLAYNYDDLIKYKYVYDFNRDGVRDEIYIVSNAFTDNLTSYNKSFSYVFIKYYNKYEEVYSIEDTIDNNLLICTPTIQNILIIDDHFYLILGCEYYSDSHEFYIFDLKENKIEQVLKTNNTK